MDATLQPAPGAGQIRHHGYNRPTVSRFYDLDSANALVPEMAAILARLRDQRAELVTLRDAYRSRVGARPAGASPEAAERDDEGDSDPELRRLRLRMRGIVDQMQAGVAWLDDRSIVLRDISTGLTDVPALVNGRQIWLCWRLGESSIDWWHELETGFAGRQPLDRLG
jgi:hypothetical protein